MSSVAASTRRTAFIMITLSLILMVCSVSADYWSDRAQFIEVDESQSIGSSLVLTEKEQEVNKILMDIKSRELDKGFKNPAEFPPAVHFFHAKNLIEQSDVFKFIQKLPKGASLHSHDTALTSLEYLYNLTHRENLYGCVVNGRLHLHFFGEDKNSDCDWQLVTDLRDRNATFDDFLKSQISIVVDDPEKTYHSIYSVWSKFLDTFGTTRNLICYRPIFKEYFYQVLQELYEDNVMYLEFRGILPEVYELNGTIYGPEEVVGFYYETLKEFLKDNPDFHGARFIYGPSRSVNNKTANSYVTTVKRLKKLYPDFIAGFDLVGQEDQGTPLDEFIPQILNLSDNKMKFFFHAAETNWNGFPVDLNIVDAILLNSTRIGHGYGIVKHPKALQELKNKNIAIEVNPISNQVLKLVEDLRNHPGVYLFANGYPVVISCDDPTMWDAKALSYDWYLAYMGFTSKNDGLKVLKQLAINSLFFSAMDQVEKQMAFAKWNSQWNVFLDTILQEFKRKHYYSFYNIKVLNN